MRHSSFSWVTVAMVCGVVLGGCAAPIPDDSSPTRLPVVKSNASTVAAGMPITFDDKASAFTEAATHTFVARSDPFALTTPQLAFEKAQGNERMLQDIGGFYQVVPPPETEAAPPVLEPQPYRRLAGVVVGQSVIGIIEIDLDSDHQQLIRPGEMLPGSEWRIVSIDRDHAVLRRAGNKLPHEISVRLESKPFGSGGPSQGNPPTGGAPAAPGGPNRPAAGGVRGD